ncbi:MAG: 30S ribosomal protein S6 [Patescibacteria group bacterium]
MSKTKFSGLGHYELLFIIPNKFTEGEATEIVEKIKKVIMEKEGNITFSEFWGKKKLSYPIKLNSFGYYSLIEFDLPGENLKKIDKTLRMSDEVIRHQIIKKKIKTAEEMEREKKISEKIAAKNIEKEQKTEDQKKEKEKNKDKKLELKDLDEKLDNILDTKDLL